MKFQEMYVIIFGVVILKLQISVSDPQFPRHIDFQKVGEAIFNNEKFNILKPSVHLITDHFKDFMLRQGSAQPGVRVFIDNNGFRHTWSGFGEKTKSLRKTDIKSKLIHVSGSFENVSEKTPESGIILTDDNTTAKVEDSNENENNTQEEENNASGNNVTVKNFTEHTQNATHAHEMNSTEITIEKRASDKKKTDNKDSSKKVQGNGSKTATTKKDNKNATTKKNNQITTTKKDNKSTAKTTKAKSNPTAKTNKPATTKAKGNPTAKTNKPTTTKAKVNPTAKTNKPTTAKAKEDDKRIGIERTVATTTYFCPFLGVITMSAFID